MTEGCGSRTRGWGMSAYFCMYGTTWAAVGFLRPQELIHVPLLLHELLQVTMFEYEKAELLFKTNQIRGRCQRHRAAEVEQMESLLHLTSNWGKKKESRFQRSTAGGVSARLRVWLTFHPKNKTQTRSGDAPSQPNYCEQCACARRFRYRTRGNRDARWQQEVWCESFVREALMSPRITSKQRIMREKRIFFECVTQLPLLSSCRLLLVTGVCMN